MLTDMISNEDPVFKKIDTRARIFDFRLDENSPAIDRGTTTALTTDLDENKRNVNAPDLGAYEKQ